MIECSLFEEWSKYLELVHQTVFLVHITGWDKNALGFSSSVSLYNYKDAHLVPSRAAVETWVIVDILAVLWLSCDDLSSEFICHRHLLGLSMY